MLSRTSTLLNPKCLLVATLWAIAAIVLSVLFRDSAIKAGVPVIFLMGLVPVGHRIGRMASLLVTIVAGVIFAVWLFQPYGSLVVRSTTDQIELLCFGVAAVGVVLFLPRHAPDSFSFENTRSIKVTAAESLENWIATVGYAVILTAVVALLLFIWNSMRN